MDADGASLSVELAERQIADDEKAYLPLDDLESTLGALEVLICEAFESDDGAPGD